ncbi:MAG TPA: DUF2804 family protein [Anaerolineaceae bacterium]
MIPWSSTRYHYTSKQNSLPAGGGTIKVGADSYVIDSQRDFACLDFDRRIWKYRSFWNWSSFSARIGGDTVGVNLGGGWTDGSGTTENSLLINGRLEKIGEDVIFEYDPHNFMTPWHIKTAFSRQVFSFLCWHFWQGCGPACCASVGCCLGCKAAFLPRMGH